jgi:hypothetical protein
MNREVHVRIWERPEVRILRATQQSFAFVDRSSGGGSAPIPDLPALAPERRGSLRYPDSDPLAADITLSVREPPKGG